MTTPREDRQTIAAGAAALRRKAIADGHLGLPRKEAAFALALLLDELALPGRQLPPAVHEQAATTARTLTGHDPP